MASHVTDRMREEIMCPIDHVITKYTALPVAHTHTHTHTCVHVLSVCPVVGTGVAVRGHVVSLHHVRVSLQCCGSQGGVNGGGGGRVLCPVGGVARVCSGGTVWWLVGEVVGSGGGGGAWMCSAVVQVVRCVMFVTARVECGEVKLVALVLHLALYDGVDITVWEW